MTGMTGKPTNRMSRKLWKRNHDPNNLYMAWIIEGDPVESAYRLLASLDTTSPEAQKSLEFALKSNQHKLLKFIFRELSVLWRIQAHREHIQTSIDINKLILPNITDPEKAGPLLKQLADNEIVVNKLTAAIESQDGLVSKLQFRKMELSAQSLTNAELTREANEYSDAAHRAYAGGKNDGAAYFLQAEQIYRRILSQRTTIDVSPKRSDMKYKIAYHVGESVDLKTKARAGSLILSDSEMQITGDDEIAVPFSSITNVELFRLHGTGRMLKVEHSSGTLFISVVRLNIGGFFMIVNFLRTGELCKKLTAAANL